jgi:hypothetical protein
MADTKYGKYLFSGLEPGGKPSPPGHGIDLLSLDDEVIRGSNFYRISWLQPCDFQDRPDAVHLPPHIHKYTELLIHLGTNPDDPFDLGAEVTVILGKEMEKNTITRSTTVYVPANFLHGWWEVKNVKRPWIFIQVNQGLMHSAKYYPQIFPKEIRDKLPPLPVEEWW